MMKDEEALPTFSGVISGEMKGAISPSKGKVTLQRDQDLYRMQYKQMAHNARVRLSLVKSVPNKKCRSAILQTIALAALCGDEKGVAEWVAVAKRENIRVFIDGFKESLI